MNIYQKFTGLRSFKILLSLVFILVLMTACGGPQAKNGTGEQAGSETEEYTGSKEGKIEAETGENPLVTIKMESAEQIKIELYPDIAPNTVANFISLIEQNFYDGLIFHRVIPGFMIQGGDPNGNGTGGPGYVIKGEFSANGFENNLKHERGVLSMAKTQVPDSAGSQFFIMVEDVLQLDGEYAAFGKVIEGMEVVDKIVGAKRNALDKPVEAERMQEVTIETFGVEYAPPEIIKEEE